MSVTNKYIFLQGPQGSGKRTLAEKLYRERGYLPFHYEGEESLKDLVKKTGCYCIMGFPNNHQDIQLWESHFNYLPEMFFLKMDTNRMKSAL